jgi:CBS domain-containing protein
MSLTVGEIMTLDPTTLSPRHHLARAAQTMDEERIRHLPIVDPDGAVVGVLSHRDLLAASAELHQPIAAAMHHEVMTIAPDALAQEAALLLLRHSIGCVPVTDEHGKLVGIVTDSDFVRVAYTLLGGQVPPDQIEMEEIEADRV